jgi:micrococcal nuclease
MSIAIILTISAVAGAACGADILRGQVIRVIDGDTVAVSMDATGECRTIRLIGIDAAPINSRWGLAPLGRAAADYTRGVLMSRDVYIEYDVKSQDSYGRDLAYIWTVSPDIWPRKMYNSQMLLTGHAITLRTPPNTRYSRFFARYEREARAARVGRWAYDGD